LDEVISMTRLLLIASLLLVAVFTMSAQQPAADDHSTGPLPGDRPAANQHSTRSVAMARHGMIATSQSLASSAGLKVLQEGGNAIDAAVTAAAVLAVVEPSMTGIGGDLFAIVYDAKTKTLHGLNASGRSAYTATPEEYAKRQQTTMPGSGVLSVTVPGVIEGWSELLSKYGTVPMSRVVAPAIDYAKNGYPVAEIVSGQWKEASASLPRTLSRPRRSCRTATRPRQVRSLPIRSLPPRSN
jgi:gamma-glutamyltranspeptidase/glutathione hydrolase